MLTLSSAWQVSMLPHVCWYGTVIGPCGLPRPVGQSLVWATYARRSSAYVSWQHSQANHPGRPLGYAVTSRVHPHGRPHDVRVWVRFLESVVKRYRVFMCFPCLNPFLYLLYIFSSHSLGFLLEKKTLDDSPSPWCIEAPSFLLPSTLRLVR